MPMSVSQVHHTGVRLVTPYLACRPAVAPFFHSLRGSHGVVDMVHPNVRLTESFLPDSETLRSLRQGDSPLCRRGPMDLQESTYAPLLQRPPPAQCCTRCGRCCSCSSTAVPPTNKPMRECFPRRLQPRSPVQASPSAPSAPPPTRGRFPPSLAHQHDVVRPPVAATAVIFAEGTRDTATEISGARKEKSRESGRKYATRRELASHTLTNSHTLTLSHPHT